MTVQLNYRVEVGAKQTRGHLPAPANMSCSTVRDWEGTYACLRALFVPREAADKSIKRSPRSPNNPIQREDKQGKPTRVCHAA